MKRFNAHEGRRKRIKLSCEQLEVRRVLDASAIPIWDQMPNVAGQALTVDAEFTATANAQFGEWTYTSSGSAVTITKYTGGGGAVTIPAVIDGLPVKAISGSVFTTFGINKTLTSVMVPASVTSISASFSGCVALQLIAVDSANTTYTSVDGVLYNKSVTTLIRCPGGKVGAVSIPFGVASIESDAFNNCWNVSSINIPSSINSIGDGAFFNCKQLTAFAVDASSTMYATTDGVLYNKSLTTLIQCPAGKAGAVAIPSSVITITSDAFAICPQLTAIVVSAGNTTYASNDGLLYNKSVTTLLRCPSGKAGAVSIQAGVKTIEADAFVYCTAVTGLTLPNSLTSLGYGAFAGCTSLTSITIPSGVTNIYSQVFESCSSLTEVTLLGAVTNIGWYAFAYCESLRTLNIWSTFQPFTDSTAFTPATSTPLPVTIYRPAGSTGWSSTLAGRPVVQFQSEFTYTASSSDLTINGFNGTATAITVPAQLFGKPVTGLGDSAFANKTGVTSVTIPAGVTSLGRGAFSGCTGLTSVTIPSTVVSIGGSAFSGCTGLASVTIPGSISSIGDSTFYGCTKLVSVTVPASVTSVGASAFQSCISLATVTLCGTVTSIGADAFSYCTTLTTLNAWGNAPSTGTTSFIASPVTIYRPAGSTGWSSTLAGRPVVLFQSEFTYTATTSELTITAYGGTAKAIAVPAQLFGKPVTGLGDSAFANKTGITSVTISAGVTSLGRGAFSGCTGLTSVTIPSTVVSIGGSAFSGCTKLTSATVPIGVTSIGVSLFYGCTALSYVTLCGAVTSIGANAFSNCSGLSALYAWGNAPTTDATAFTASPVTVYRSAEGTGWSSTLAGRPVVQFQSEFTYTASSSDLTVTGFTGTATAITVPAQLFGKPVTGLGDSAFANKTGITSVTIPSTVFSIGESAFSGCTKLTSATVPVGVTSIRTNVFYGCTGLSSVTLHGTVISIGANAFGNCTALTSLNAWGNAPSTDATAFTASPVTIYRPANSSGWSSTLAGRPVVLFQSEFTYTATNYELKITGYGGADKAVSIPTQLYGLPVTAIGDSAFANKTEITSVTIPTGVTSIGANVFSGCTGLTGVSIPSGVTSIASSAFSGCTELMAVTIPSTVTSIGGGAFYGCVKLSSVIIPASVTGIGVSAFQACTGLVGVTLYGTVISIGANAFSNCSVLTALNAWGNAPSTDATAFTASPVTIYRPASSSGWSSTLAGRPVVLFQSEFTYTATNYELKITGYGGAAKAVVIPTQLYGLSVTVIGDSAFANKTGITEVAIPAGVRSIGANVFSGCTGLTSVSIPFGVTSIGSGAFQSCRRLTTVSLPASVTGIGINAFWGCTGLTSIVIPSSVSSIGQGAFSGCSALAAINVEATNTSYASLNGLLFNKALTTLIQCPAAAVGGVSIPSSVTDLGSNAFENCLKLSSVTVPAGVTSIGVSAFSGCTGLTSLLFLGNRPSVATGAFNSSPATIYRIVIATGWSSTFGGRPVEIFQPMDVPAGQTIAATIAVETSRVLKQGAGTAILNTPITRTGGTVVEAGEIVVSHKNALGTGLLEVQAGAKATLQVGYASVLVTSLSLANSARLELGTSKLSVAANGFTESDIRSKLIAGRNGGRWDGASGITSTFAGGDRSIGYQVADGVLKVGFAAPGDSNLDGLIDILDLSEILSAGRFNTGGIANWTQGDTNYDGVFDILDLSEILGTGLFNQGNYLTQPAASSAAADTGSVATFDPALVFAALAMDSGGQTTTKRKNF